MKKIKFQSFAALVFIVALLTSCSSDNDNTPTDTNIYKSAFATDVTGPTTGLVNQELTFNVSYEVENGCAEFHRMTDVNIDKLDGYQVEVKYPATCSTNAPEIKRTPYKVKSNIKGTFYLRFAKSETEFITKTVVIE